MSGIKDVNTRELRQAINNSTTQSQLALLTYSLLATIESEQASQQWDAIRAQRPERKPQPGEMLRIEGRSLIIDDVVTEGSFAEEKVKTIVKASLRESMGPGVAPFGGERTWSTELDASMIAQDDTDRSPFPRWRLKAGLKATFLTVIKRTVKGR